ncbi:MAG: NPCBM/NEW2 domain-containing protein [Phycisphaerae bacterium]
MSGETHAPTSGVAPEAPSLTAPARGPVRLWTAAHAVELAAVFALGVAVMAFMYADPRSGRDPGAPGHDSFYHVKMAALIPELGLVDTFPWLRFCWFTDAGDAFVSHHYGFHALLMPFVLAAKATTGEYLPGGRWAICTFFGLSLSLFHLLLMSEGVRWRWVWLIALLVMPSQFFGRHAFVRAISPSLCFMLLILLLMFRGRYVLTGLAVAAFNHLYLGAVPYSVVLVAMYIASRLVGPRDDRSIEWKLFLFAAGGWWLGILTYPYSGVFRFLWLQIFGTGLAPTISVGQEWQSYSPAWFFVQMSWPLLAIWGTALALRMRLGPRLSGKELSVLLTSFVFLAMTLKARRFIEYWPAFCLLSAAMMSRPIIVRLAGWFDPAERGETTPLVTGVQAGVACGVLGAVVVLAMRTHWQVDRFAVEWATWVLVATLYMAVPIGRVWLRDVGVRGGGVRIVLDMAVVPVTLALFAVVVGVLFRWVFDADGDVPVKLLASSGAGVGLLSLCGVAGIAAGGAVVVAAVRRGRQRRGGDAAGTPAPTGPSGAMVVGRTLATLSSGLAVVSVMCLIGAKPLADRQSDIKCQYDLPKIRAAMAFLKAYSEPGDVVFTDDWDIFPVYFYYNSYNHYIVGLDPEFTHHRDPELWDRYVKISRGQVPSMIDVSERREDGTTATRRVPVKLEDIRDRFGARFVITDRDHKSLSAKLARATDFAELIYPSASYEDCRHAPYLIFRVRDEGEVPATTRRVPDQHGIVYLSLLTPVAVTQGWGDFSLDHAVGGGPLMLGGKVYLRGLGTHATSRIEYDIPDGYARFDAVAGLDRGSEDRGSIVLSVELDGRNVYTSPVLRGDDAPVDVRIELGDAKRITLIADETADGNRFDHADWAMARFVKAPAGK